MKVAVDLTHDCLTRVVRIEIVARHATRQALGVRHISRARCAAVIWALACPFDPLYRSVCERRVGGHLSCRVCACWGEAAAGAARGARVACDTAVYARGVWSICE